MMLPEWALRSGPRKTIYHNPKEVYLSAPRTLPTLTPLPQVLAAIVTCGGLCPGLNDVVQVRPFPPLLLLRVSPKASRRT